MKFLRSLLAITGLCLLAVAAGCDAKTLQDIAEQVNVPRTGLEAQPASQQGTAAPITSGETIRIATFNIQVFGTSKSKKPHVMNILADVARKFDVVAIQELRTKEDKAVLDQYVSLINAAGVNYTYIVGPRLGRSSSKEQYIYVFNTQRIAVDTNSIYTVSDPRDLLHREPLVARFRTLGVSSGEAFTFSLVNIHTDPDETDQELDALADVFVSVQRNNSGEDDVIMLGDLNVDERHLGQLGQLPNIRWVVRGEPTNTRGSKSYDNIVFNFQSTTEFTGRAGIVNLLQDYNLTMEQALEVSDHLPVWAEFSVYEGGSPRVASQPR